MNKDLKKRIELFANDIRRETAKEIAEIGVGHMGGTFSAAEVLAVLYEGIMKYDPNNPEWEYRDRFVLSKGHAGPALYAILAMKGFFPMEWLLTLNKNGTNLPSHPDRLKTPGVDVTTGSLGQGLSVAAGVAMGMRFNGIDSRVFVVCGDGECNEGQIWEAAMFASHRKLNNLIVFVDRNLQQCDGFSDAICDIGDVKKKFEAFDWFSLSVDGHSVEEIYDAVQLALKEKEKPSMIVLHTVKGKGASLFEGKRLNHNPTVSKEQLEICLREINDARERILKD